MWGSSEMPSSVFLLSWLMMVVRAGMIAAQPVEVVFSDGEIAIIAGGLGTDALVVAKAPGLVEEGQSVRTVMADAR